MKSPIICAIDTKDLNQAQEWIEALLPEVQFFKLGLEFFAQHGPNGIEKIRSAKEFDLFLDLKLHDIPNTVAGAVSAVTKLAPKFLTVHASGGSAMIKAAVEAGPNIDITAVTLLTSLGEQDLTDIGFAGEFNERSAKLAQLAISSGAKAVVTSPLEVESIRATIGNDPIIITPGVRPLESTGNDDQKRIMDPASAIKAGSNYLVIGRPITGKAGLGLNAMVDAAKKINDSLA
jgi:orotidine-5'-phosphate decarboxylase